MRQELPSARDAAAPSPSGEVPLLTSRGSPVDVATTVPALISDCDRTSTNPTSVWSGGCRVETAALRPYPSPARWANFSLENAFIATYVMHALSIAPALEARTERGLRLAGPCQARDCRMLIISLGEELPFCTTCFQAGGSGSAA
ncbi:hypothetical protein CNECB9_2360004 [Cupriavidus necator]|uniref:Uncharacterized protein n=1 Tax=Cupriavidus necator TaxID=106590 RepID=A0A1K0JJL6_CUPNE|nr:hypothetical protein CNECB9_2360004 [Cupriavidus necator]